MSGERFDYTSERQRHEKFVGREALLDRLDDLLVQDGPDRWVVITGGPGMGKSAILSAWLARCEAARAFVPHHFIRRGAYDWDSPAQMVASLVAQIDERFPGAREPDPDARVHPAARLARALSRVSEQELGPRRERLVVVLDGLDEYDPPTGALPGDPLAAFLPHALPRGVSFLCSSRPRHPYVSSLEARDGDFVEVDLDAPDSVADNEATVRGFWESAAGPLALHAHFIDEAVARAGGNVQHAVQLRRQVVATPTHLRRVEDIPRGLWALIDQTWERIAHDAVVVEGLGILCVAREALTLDELGTVAGWTADATRRAFLRGAKEVLVETQRLDREREYRPHHDSIRTHIAQAVGDAALRGHHRALAQRLATWPAPPQMAASRYALRHALIHRAQAGDWSDAWRIASDTRFLETKCREFSAQEVEADITRIAELCRASGDATICHRFSGLARALARESHWLRAAPEAAAAVLWNRLRRSGWSEHELGSQLRVSTDNAFLRVRHVATRDSPALVRNLVGHAGRVIACATTPDGRRVVSASTDQTLKVWDLESGRALVTLHGHPSWATKCAVTSDGRRVVSVSEDRSRKAWDLNVWDLESGRALATLQGHASGTSGCLVTPDCRRVVLESDDTLKVWDVESGRVLATLKSRLHSWDQCAVTPDGRRVVWVSNDTLRVWDVESGRVISTLIDHIGRVSPKTACAVTPDGRRVVSVSSLSDDTLKVWDVESDRELAPLKCSYVSTDRAQPVEQASLPNPLEATTMRLVLGYMRLKALNGRFVVSASNDTLTLWDLDRRRGLATREGHAGWLDAFAVTADGRRVVSGFSDHTLKVWDAESGRVITVVGHTGGVTACAVTPDSRHVISASQDQMLKVWDLEDGCEFATLEGHAYAATACAVTPDSCRGISASNDQTLKVWDVESGRARATLKGHTSMVSACAVTPDGQRVVSASYDRTLKVWDVESGCALATLKGHTSMVSACAVTPDGQRVVSASYDRILKVWDLESRRALATLEGHADAVTACTVAPDSRRALSASEDRTLKVWDLESGQELATLEGHANTVTACAVMPDGRRAVSASHDKTLKVWDMGSGRVLATLEGHADVVTACAVAPDGRRVVSASHDKTLKVWDLATCACLFTHRGDAPYVAVAVGAGGVVAGDSTGGIWFLDWPASDCRARLVAVSERERRQHESHSAPETSSSRSTSKHTILFLAANPTGTSPLALGEEARAIQVELERSGYREYFELETRWAAQPLDLLRELRKLKPTIVHFSGHGGRSPVGQGPGLFFHGPDGRTRAITAQALHDTFGAAGASVRLVVLSACNSDVQAEVLRAHVDCVVGIGGSISDNAARSFAIGFYGGLGERESVAAAFHQGCAAISLEGLRESDRPHLAVRNGIDASKVVLATDA